MSDCGVSKKSLERKKRQGLGRCLANMSIWVQAKNSGFKK